MASPQTERVGRGVIVSMTHPFDPDSLYELTEDGTIKISRDGKTGFFTGEGIYISGECGRKKKWEPKKKDQQ